MRSVLKIMWANIRHKKGAFKGVIALMAVMVMSFAITISNTDNNKRAIKDALKRADAEGIFISINSDQMTDEISDSFDKNNDVASWRTEKRMMTQQTKEINGKSKDVPDILAKNNGNYRFFDDNDNIRPDSVTIGKGEIYLSYKMKKDKDISIGSDIKFTVENGGSETFTVKGFYEDPLFGEIMWGINNALISNEDFDRIYAENADIFTDSAIVSIRSLDYCYLRLRDGADSKDVIKALDEECGLKDASNFIYEASTFELYNSLIVDTGTKVITLFTALLLLIVLITINDNIASSVEMDYSTLGILKANGFTIWQIRMIFICQYVLALVIGSVIGIILTIPLTGLLGGQFMKITALFTENRISLGKSALVSLVIMLICVFFISLSTRRVGKISPVRAISGGKDEVYFDSRLNVRIRKKPLGFFVALRQITSRITGYVGSTAIVSLLVFFMICVMALTDGLDAKTIFSTVENDIVAVIDSDFELSDMAALRNFIEEQDKNGKVSFMDAINGDIDDEQYIIRVHDGEDALFPPLDGRPPEYDNEIYITELLADEMDKKIGDSITVRNNGKEADFIITGFFQTVYDAGRELQITVDGAVKLGHDTPYQAYITLSDKSRCEAVKDAINDEFKGIYQASLSEPDSSIENMIDTVDTLLVSISSAIYAVCIIFAAIAVHLVCAKTFQRERHDIGIYKSQGFTSKDLRIQFALRFAVISLIGSVIGSVSAFFLTRPLLSALMRIIGLSNFLPDFGPLMFLLPAAAMTASFFVFAYAASSSINNVEIRELITE